MPNNSRTTTPAPSNNNEHYFRWTHTLTLKLIDILGQHYERNQEYTLLKLYQGGKKGGMKKVEVAKIIADKFNDDDPKPTHQKVMTKIKGLEQDYQAANTFLNSTGEGINDNEEKLKITSIKELYPLIHDKPKVNTPFRIDSEGDLAQEAERILDGNGENDEEENEENGVPEATIASRLQAGLARLHGESDDCDDGSEEEDAGDSIFGDELGGQSSRTTNPRKRSAPPSNTSKSNKRQYTKKGPSLGESILRMGEMRMEMEERKMDNKMKLEKERNDLLRAQILAKVKESEQRNQLMIQESKERSLMLELELQKLKQQNNNNN
ncbi:hypothetical protein BDA99DRAFT_606005 [Phascolomyces articulosus]|uniref:Uncharacterized protein n=1 Tax=Phascolomyces articulosus TaxID=60185 RepID=A0AAD5K7G8_9FUNG|nr:hypothetical protein BDA99DRAFT_606005 [Phascolomyces articulosus]